MKKVNLLLAAVIIAGLAGIATGQDTLHYEYFTDGTLNLNWFTPWDPGNNMIVDYWEGNPSGDTWVGFIGNDSSGGGVGTALSGESNMTDYEIQAQIYCTVNTSTYHAVVARWDTTGYNKYYAFRSDFDADRRLQLIKYVSGFPPTVTIAQWVGGEIPGGLPTQDGWHHMALKCEGDQLRVYWDGTELSGSPFTDDEYSNGFFGVYVFNFMGNDSTYCDDIIVLGEAGPQPFDFITDDNHFLDESLQPMTLRPAEGQTIHFQLDWQALNGITTSPPFDITLMIDNNEIFRENNPGVEPNTSHETISSAWTAALGEHTLTWTLDVDNAVPESNEDNNILEEPFLVLPTTAYDFQADSSWLANGDTVQFEDSLFVGHDVLFVLFWSVPMGEGSSGAFNIEMELDGEQFYQVMIPGVTSGQNYTTVTNSWTATEGFHYYTWEIDPDNWVEEFIEYNNSILDGFDVFTSTSVPRRDYEEGFLPIENRICGVYPNPFNPAVTLRYEIAQPGAASLIIYDVTGREVAKLMEGFTPAGFGAVTWEADGIASGTYFAVLDAGGRRSVQRLLLVK